MAKVRKRLRVEVGAGFIGDIFCRQGWNRARQVHRLIEALQPKGGEKWHLTLTFEQFAKVSIWAVLAKFQLRLVNVIREIAPDLLSDVRDEFVGLGRDAYNQPGFEVDDEHVLGWMSLRGVAPHGRLRLAPEGDQNAAPAQSCYLPDLSLDIRLYSFFSSDRLLADDPIGYMHNNAHYYDKAETTGILDGEVGLSTIECHLSDTVLTAYQRAAALADRLTKDEQRLPLGVELEDRSRLVIDGVVRGFRGYRSLRRTDPQVPLVGAHPALSRAAIRQGLAWPKVSSIIPRRVWSQLSDVAKDIVVETAEVAAGATAVVVCPLTPTESEMSQLKWVGGLAQLDLAVGPLLEQQSAPLRKLGIYDVVLGRHRGDEYQQRLGDQQWAWDWTWAFGEVMDALYDPRVDRSHRNTLLYRLQPLHKRLLGIFEQSVITPLRAKVTSKVWVPKGGVTQQASNLWRDAFSGTVANQPITEWNDFRATLDIHGHWLVEAAKVSQAGPCRLSKLLDGIVAERIRTTPALAGFNISLAPSTPNAHARQLRAVAESTDEARTLTLFLGRVALEFRNVIEHGIELPMPQGLLIQNEDMWQSKRDYARKGKKGGDKRPESVSLLEWIRRTATDQDWSRKALLPATVPQAGTGVLLDTDSLGRCLVLISLLIAGAQTHLKLK